MRFSWLICVLLLSVVGCTKSEYRKPAPTYTSSGRDAKLFAIFSIDTSNPAAPDTVSSWYYKYDRVNRVISDSFTTTTVAANTVYTRVKNIYYTANDSLAYRSISRTWIGKQNPTIDTTDYFFTGSQYIGDTTVYDYGVLMPGGSSRTQLSYQQGAIIRNFQNWHNRSSYSISERDTIRQTIMDNNMVIQSNNTWFYLNGRLSGTQAFETTVSYLNNPNPFHKVNGPTSKRYFTGIGIGNFFNNEYAPEHLISYQTSSAGNVTYQYTFRRDGYPVSAIVTQEQKGVRSVTKLVFVYGL